MNKVKKIAKKKNGSFLGLYKTQWIILIGGVSIICVLRFISVKLHERDVNSYGYNSTSIPPLTRVSPRPTEIIEPDAAEVKQSSASVTPSGCEKIYNSTYADLSFPYNSCAWTINEIQENADSESAPDTIIATHSISQAEAIIDFVPTGFDGGFPFCRNINSATIITSDIIRVNIKPTNPYQTNNLIRYLTSKHNVGIKGYSGPNGQSKFAEFSFLNKQDYLPYNICFNDGGMVPIPMIDFSQKVDVRMSLPFIEESASSKMYFSDADTLARDVYSVALHK